MASKRNPQATQNALSVATATTAVTRELVDMMQILPAKAAASILLMIFDTIENIQSNKYLCIRLAQRCLRLLLDVRSQMEGRWKDAPPSMLRSFQKLEQTLTSIHDFMKSEAEAKWHSRLLRKRAIEQDIADLTADLEDAARAFQISTLISIHHAIGDRTPHSEILPPYTKSDEKPEDAGVVEPEDGGPLNPESSPPREFSSLSLPQTDTPGTNGERLEDFVVIEQISKHLSPAVHQPIAESTIDQEDKAQTLMNIVVETTSEPELRRYHQSELKILGPSRIRDGWWAGCLEVEAKGQKFLLKQYEAIGSERNKAWARDVGFLRLAHHPHLPQIVGISQEGAHTPFIVLDNAGTRLPQAVMKEKIKNGSVASCTRFLLRIYIDIMDTGLFVQRQLNLSDSKLQDYLENASYRYDARRGIVIGLSPPELDDSISIRQWGLIQSVHTIVLQMLPKSIAGPATSKVHELANLVMSCFSKIADGNPVPQGLLQIMEQGDEEVALIMIHDGKLGSLVAT